VDLDGDGRFDHMRDYKKGVTYNLKGLQWVEADRSSTENVLQPR